MQRLASPRLLYRPSTGNPPWRWQVRRVQYWPALIKKIPMRQKFPQYEISDLVLNLDAEDSAYVRAYDKEKDGVPEGRFAKRERAQDALKQRVSEFDDLYEKDATRFRMVLSTKGSAWQISDLDVMSLSLGGLPKSAATATTSQSSSPVSTGPVQTENLSQAVLDWNGIPQHARHSSAQAMPYVLRRQYLTRQKLARTRDERWLSESLSRSLSFTEVKRLVLNLMQTSNGAQLVAQCSGEIGNWCYAHGQVVEPTASEEILIFINDVYSHLVADHQEVSPRLRQAGLLFALRCRAFSAARHFLGSDLTRPSQHLDQFAQDLRNELQVILQSLQSSTDDQKGVLRPTALHDYRIAVYSFLTGQGPCGLSYPSSMKDAFFLRADESSAALIEPYLEILAELGAIRTLWHELHCWKAMLSSNISTTATTTATTPADILARLHQPEGGGLLSRALFRFSSKVQNGELTLSASDLAGATGQFGSDCQMDLRNIMQSSASITASESMHDAPPQTRSEPKDVPDNLYHARKKFPAGVIARKLSFGLSDAIVRPTIQESMSAVCTVLFEKPTIQDSMTALRTQLMRNRARKSKFDHAAKDSYQQPMR